jgi:hypothetical protein
MLDCRYPREGGRGQRGSPRPCSVFLFCGLLVSQRRALVQYPACPLHEIHRYFGALVRLRELVHQAQKLFSHIVDQEVSQLGFLPDLS